MRPTASFRAVAVLILALPILAASSAVLIWPLPQCHTVDPDAQALTVDPASFQFVAAGPGAGSAVLKTALARYRQIVFPDHAAAAAEGGLANRGGAAAVAATLRVLGSLTVAVGSASEELELHTSENYSLTIAAANGPGGGSVPSGRLEALTVFGALRGLESFSQMLYSNNTIAVQAVVDWPRFPFRGLMVDSARHFLPLPLLLANLDAMAYNKMNVLHWHMTDTESFPYRSAAFPALADKGAFDRNHVYSQEDIASVVDYARERGVMVIPEFDTPAHTAPSWGKGGPPNLLTTCGDTGAAGPLRPDLNQTYAFLGTLFDEVVRKFQTKIFHAGGDEVDLGCWQSNPEVVQFMADHNLNATGLNNLYMDRLFQTVLGRTAATATMVWRPGAADMGATPPRSTIFDVYSGPLSAPIPPDGQGGYNVSATATTAAGYRVVRSAGYYLDQLCDPDPDGSHRGTYWGYFEGWKYYSRDPVTGEIGPDGRPELVLGGKANMWGEHVDATNFMPRVWPRASVIAERLWSAADVTDIGQATPRLHEFRCRMAGRGIAAGPIGVGHDGPFHPSFCGRQYPFAYFPP